jgi:hypothetical protein
VVTFADQKAFAAAVAAAVEANKAPAAPEPPAPEVPITADQFLSAEEKSLLASYDKEWGEVAKAESVRRRSEMQAMQAQTYRELEKVLAPIVHTLRESQVQAHFATIHRAHADYDTVIPDVKQWVESQPAFYRPVMERVLANGTASEVVELVRAFKQATGKTGAVPEVPASSIPQATSAPATPVVRQQPSLKAVPPPAAVAATAAVVSQRSNSQSAADPNDFYAALKDALSA